ncbi:MAG: SGNH/GDSL hydrolase family protein [Clostridia bacterium]|nr:SGNH/GDSL hydrolase family protein [Clostridia bacterium]
MKTILFQGDSITDCGRARDRDTFRGVGYPALVTAKLNYEYPGEYHVINRGVSGNRIVDLYARVKKDIINLAPDYMSILIGLNDVWHEVDEKNGVDAEKFEKIYDMLITEIKEALPDLKIIIMAPYVTKGSATEATWDYFSGEVAKREKAAERIAKKHNLKFVTTQDKFDEMLKKHPEPYWTQEGVHPTEAGHALLAGLWLSAFEEIK